MCEWNWFAITIISVVALAATADVLGKLATRPRKGEPPLPVPTIRKNVR